MEEKTKNGLTVIFDIEHKTVSYVYNWKWRGWKFWLPKDSLENRWVAFSHKIGDYPGSDGIVKAFDDEARRKYGRETSLRFIEVHWAYSFYLDEYLAYLNSPAATSDYYKESSYTPKSKNSDSPGLLAEKLPGINEKVACPCSCEYSKETVALYTAIAHLNDNHRWSRDSIADWVETLDIDTTFKEKV